MATYLAFQGSSPNNTFKTWNNIQDSSPSNLDLLDEDGVSSGYGYSSNPVPGTAPFGADSVGTGDASWVDESEIMRWGHYTGSSTAFKFFGPAGESVDIEFCSSMPAGRQTRVIVGSESYTFPDVERSTSATYIFVGATFNVDGEISGAWEQATSGSSYIMAARITESAPSAPNTPINPGTTNLLSTSVRLNWEQG